MRKNSEDADEARCLFRAKVRGENHAPKSPKLVGLVTAALALQSAANNQMVPAAMSSSSKISELSKLNQIQFDSKNDFCGIHSFVGRKDKKMGTVWGVYPQTLGKQTSHLAGAAHTLAGVELEEGWRVRERRRSVTLRDGSPTCRRGAIWLSRLRFRALAAGRRLSSPSTTASLHCGFTQRGSGVLFGASLARANLRTFPISRARGFFFFLAFCCDAAGPKLTRPPGACAVVIESPARRLLMGNRHGNQCHVMA